MYIRVHSKRIHYKKLGNGQPIVFVHGWGGSLQSLYPLAKLASKHFAAYLLDLPGFGKSEDPDHDWGVKEYAETILRFSQRLHIATPHYFGHSFGGGLGLYLSSQFPDSISKLIICSSAYKRNMKKTPAAQLVNILHLKNLPIAKHLYNPAVWLYYKLFQRGSDLLKQPHLQDNFRKIITQSFEPYILNNSKKTLIVWGENDKDTPALWAYEIQKKLHNSRLIVFPNETHNLPIKHPEAVWQEVYRFLSP